MILCNPHNPTGNIWTKEQLACIGELCRKYNVTVLSDEIHCDLTNPGYEYTPFAAASDVCKDISITCISATKAFNIAGLQTAAVITPKEKLRNIIVRGINSDEIAEPNAFAVDAVIGAFTGGKQWLDELRQYLYENKKYASKFFEEELPDLRLVPSNATYLLWIDCHKITDNASKLQESIRNKTGLYVSAGNQYRGNGQCFIRMNIACPKELLKDGLERLKKGIS